MEQAVSESEAPRRFNTALISAFAIAAVLLAALGIYSIMAFSTALRVHEMAIRLALGSQRPCNVNGRFEFYRQGLLVSKRHGIRHRANGLS
jgi:hypothetical protein